MTDEMFYDDSEDEEFDGYISESEVMRIIGLEMEMDESSKEDENETENDNVCEAGDGMHNDNEIMEHEKEMNDAEVDMEIADIENIVVRAIGNVASDIPEFVGQPEGTRHISNKSPVEFFDLLVTEQILEEISEQIIPLCKHAL